MKNVSVRCIENQNKTFQKIHEAHGYELNRFFLSILYIVFICCDLETLHYLIISKHKCSTFDS